VVERLLLFMLASELRVPVVRELLVPVSLVVDDDLELAPSLLAEREF
jgi:hypothetical protein